MSEKRITRACSSGRGPNKPKSAAEDGGPKRYYLSFTDGSKDSWDFEAFRGNVEMWMGRVGFYGGRKGGGGHLFYVVCARVLLLFPELHKRARRTLFPNPRLLCYFQVASRPTLPYCLKTCTFALIKTFLQHIFSTVQLGQLFLTLVLLFRMLLHFTVIQNYNIFIYSTIVHAI